MATSINRYQFRFDIKVEEIEETLLMAIIAAECLWGKDAVEAEFRHFLCVVSKRLVIDASTEIGKGVDKLFFGLFDREFGETAFSVEHGVPRREAWFRHSLN